MTSTEEYAKHRNEAQLKGIVSPYRLALYCCARRAKYTEEQALEAAKICDPKIVSKLERGK